MCECGCSEFRGGLRFPGPNGSTYVLRVYPGCSDCHAPVGVDLTRFDVEHDRFVDGIQHLIDASPDLTFRQDVRGMHTAAVPVLGGDVMKRVGTEMGFNEVVVEEIADNLEAFVAATEDHYREFDARAAKAEPAAGGPNTAARPRWAR